MWKSIILALLQRLAGPDLLDILRRALVRLLPEQILERIERLVGRAEALAVSGQEKAAWVRERLQEGGAEGLAGHLINLAIELAVTRLKGL